MLFGLDISNHNGTPEGWPQQGWYARYQESQFVIAQAIPRPAPNGMVGAQLAQISADAKSPGAYSWLWHDPSWRLGDQTVEDDQRIRLATIPESQEIVMRPWLDVEDNQSTGWNNVSIEQRVDDVNRAFEVLDAWANKRNLPEAGIYWSRYFIDLLFGGANFWPERKQWLADYGANPHSRPGYCIGGTVVAHQYASRSDGVSIDLNLMLESEIVTTQPATTTVDPQVYKDALERAHNRLQIELERRLPSGKLAALRRPIIAEIEHEIYQAWIQ